MRLRSLTVTILVATLGFYAALRSATVGEVIFHAGGLAPSGNPAALFLAVNKDIEIFDKSLNVITKIRAKFVEAGGAVATDGTLYIGYGYQSLVQIFKAPYTGKPIEFHLQDPQHQPLSTTDIAIDRHTGLVAISSYVASHLAGGPAGVFFFRPGETQPCNFLHGDADVLTFDSAGTLFYTTDEENGIGMIQGGCGATAFQPIPLAGIVFEIKVDGDDNLVTEQYDPAAHHAELVTYPHPIFGKLGPPIVRTLEPLRCFLGRFTSDGKDHWDTCYDSNTSVKEYQYKVSGPPLRTIQEHKNKAGIIDILPPLIP